jgi:uncharacterized protein
MDETNRHYTVARPPLVPTSFVRLPFGSIAPRGWLKRQLEIEAGGLARRLLDPELFDRILGPCKGSLTEEYYQRAVYQEGLVTLAGMTGDPAFVKAASESVEATLAEDPAWLGGERPEREAIIYGRGRQTRGLVEHFELTGDPRIVPWLTRLFHAWGASDITYWWWPESGTTDLLHVGLWLYNRTGDPIVLACVHRKSAFAEKVTDSFLAFPGGEYERHNVVVAWISRLPAVRWALTGDARYRRATFDGIEMRDRCYGQVGGRYAGHEHFPRLEDGLRPTNGTELCGVVEYLYSMEKLFEMFGDSVLADRLEALAYNALPGACTADLQFHQYDQQANQVDVSVAPRGFDNSETANLYAIAPHYPCCTYNMHHAWPRLVEHLWMATHDQGLVAAAYAPCRVSALVADGSRVTVTETTEYPFDGTVRFRLDTGRPARFPVSFRIPGWADGAELSFPGGTARCVPGAIHRVERTWQGGDECTLTLPTPIRTETRFNGAIAILRGPLYFSLRIGASYRDLGGGTGWDIQATTPWNYGLETTPDGRGIEAAGNAVGGFPFASRGEPVNGEPYAGSEPVVLKVRGRRIAGWGRDREYPANTADPPPSPVRPDGPVEDLELIPYGCSRLRISEFPWTQRTEKRR